MRSARLRVFGHGRISTVRGRRAAYPADTGGELYSAAFVNTCERVARSMLRTPESTRMDRDTPCLYALYSDVFRRHLHTNSSRKPYCRKGFQICIQCIQRIPTPFVFRFSLLLGREYTHTCPLAMPSHLHAEPRMHRTPPPVTKGVNHRENGPLAYEHAVSYIAYRPGWHRALKGRLSVVFGKHAVPGPDDDRAARFRHVRRAA